MITATNESGNVLDTPKNEITMVLAQQHHGTGDLNKWRPSALTAAAEI
jgi:hypothetical protein